jgi:rhodanese-related sulfurtransferase
MRAGRLRAWACLGLLSLGLPLAANPFVLSHAQATPDPAYGRPEFADKWPHINLAEALRLHGKRGVVFVDGRSVDKRFPMLKRKLAKAKIVVTYCHGVTCGLSENLAQLLSDQGLRNVAVFYEGFPAWAGAGQPLEASPSKP